MTRSYIISELAAIRLLSLSSSPDPLLSQMAAVVSNLDIYDPQKVLGHPDFRILKEGEKLGPDANIAAFYNPAHEVHLVEKPKPKPGPGQVLIHVRATGICGSVYP
jgi:L-iditol 2-dehydrogenase